MSTAPPTTIKLSVTPKSATAVGLSWIASPPLHHVKWQLGINGIFAPVNGSPHPVDGLDAGRTYSFQVSTTVHGEVITSNIGTYPVPMPVPMPPVVNVVEKELTGLDISFPPFSSTIFMQWRVRRRNGLSCVPINENKVLFWNDAWDYTMLSVPTGWRLANEDSDCALVGTPDDPRLILADTCYDPNGAAHVFEYSLSRVNGLPTSLTQVNHQTFGTDCKNLRTLVLPSGGMMVEAVQGGAIDDYNTHWTSRDANGAWAFPQFKDLGGAPAMALNSELFLGQGGLIYELIGGDGTARFALVRWREISSGIEWVDWDFAFLAGGDVEMSPDGENPPLKIAVNGKDVLLMYTSNYQRKPGCLAYLSRPVVVKIDTSVNPPGKSLVCFIPEYGERSSQFISLHASAHGIYYHTTPMDMPDCDMSRLYKRKIVNGAVTAAEDVAYDLPVDYQLKAWGFDDQANGDVLIQRDKSLFLRKVIPQV